MVSLFWEDIILRLIPEALIIILAGYAIAKKTMNIKLYLISSIILALINFLFRALPISTIIPMVLSGIAAVMLLRFVNKIKVIHGILSTLLCYILLIVSEGLNIFLLGKLFGLDTNKIFLTSSPLEKNLYGLPSLLIFGLIIISYYLIFTRKKAKANVDN